MRQLFCLPVLAILAAVVAPTLAIAKPTQSTRYTYYSITGTTASAIYQAMVKRGPEVEGVNAYASTASVTTQKGQMAQGKSCFVKEYSLNMDFVVKLPKLKSESALKGSVKTNWQSFSRFLKTHEDTHRQIWLACGTKLESEVRALKYKDCKGLEKQAAKLWQKMRTSCARKHEAFDAAEQRNLLKQPFIKLALGQRFSSTRAIVVAPKKKKP